MKRIRALWCWVRGHDEATFSVHVGSCGEDCTDNLVPVLRVCVRCGAELASLTPEEYAAGIRL